MSRKRRPDESFEDYKVACRQERHEEDKYLKGRMVHISKVLVKTDGGFFLLPGKTYVKPKDS